MNIQKLNGDKQIDNDKIRLNIVIQITSIYVAYITIDCRPTGLTELVSIIKVKGIKLKTKI